MGVAGSYSEEVHKLEAPIPLLHAVTDLNPHCSVATPLGKIKVTKRRLSELMVANSKCCLLFEGMCRAQSHV